MRKSFELEKKFGEKFFGPTRRPNLDPTAVDLRWLGGRTWAEVAFGLPPVAGRRRGRWEVTP